VGQSLVAVSRETCTLPCLRTRSGGLSALIASLWLAGLRIAAPAAAQSEPVPLDLSWSAPAGCPTQAAIRADTLGMVKLARGQKPVPVRARVEVAAHAGGAWQALIHTHHDAAAGERSLTASDCAELGRAVALVLALALSAEPIESSPAPDAPEPTPDPPLAVRSEARAALPATTQASSARWGLGLDLTAGTGALPKLGTGLTLRLVLAWWRVSAHLRASAFLPRSVAVSGSESGRATFYAAQLGLAGCYDADGLWRLGFFGCVGGDFAWARGETERVLSPGGASGHWPRLFLEGGLRLALVDGLAVRLALEVGRALARPRFAVEARGVVYEPSANSARAILGADLYF
jgi:hypothetical protein